MRLYSIILLLLIYSGIFAQNNRSWATYYGGSLNDYGKYLATDMTGNIYLEGYTNSTNAIASSGFQNVSGGSNDVYLVKFDAAGNRSWATYYGGIGDELAGGIITGDSGKIFFAGTTYSASGIASGGFQNTFGGTKDAFLVCFDSTGNRIWATYYGGSGLETASDIITDAAGNIYLAGYTSSTFGIASGGFQSTYGGGTSDAFLVKFDGAGNRIWATYYGGPGGDNCMSIAVDPTGNIIITGLTESTSGIASGGFQNSYGGGTSDSYIVKFDLNGNRLWASYYGGTAMEDGYGVGTDAAGNIYLGGNTESTSGIANTGFQNIIGGGRDAFLVKFDMNGNRIWSSYYGGTGYDVLLTLTLDYSGNIFFGGRTGSTTSISSGGFQNTYGGGSNDSYLAAFDPAGNRLCATYYGGAGSDRGYDIVADSSGYIYFTGQTDTIAGIASGGFQNTYGGGVVDALLVKFSSCALTSVSEQTRGNSFNVFPNPSSGKITVENSGDITIYNVLGKLILLIRISGDKTEIDMSDYPKGIYFIELRSGEKTVIQKLVLQ